MSVGVCQPASSQQDDRRDCPHDRKHARPRPPPRDCCGDEHGPKRMAARERRVEGRDVERSVVERRLREQLLADHLDADGCDEYHAEDARAGDDDCECDQERRRQRDDVHRHAVAGAPAGVEEGYEPVDHAGFAVVETSARHQMVDGPLVDARERTLGGDGHGHGRKRAREQKSSSPEHARAVRRGRSRSGPVSFRPARRRARSAGVPARRRRRCASAAARSSGARDTCPCRASAPS